MKLSFSYKNKNEYLFNDRYQYFEMLIYCLVCFFIPLLAGHQQLFTGIVVNSMLTLAALNLKGYKLLPVIIMPTIGALTAGILFGSFTIYLIYMIPFIWIANSILVFSIKHFNSRSKLMSILLSSSLKSAFLFTAAFILFQLSIIPSLFLTAFGIMQLTTALIGSTTGIALNKLLRQKIA